MPEKLPDRERVNALFATLKPENVRKHLKDGLFQPEDVPQLQRMLAKHDFWDAMPRFLGPAAVVVTAVATVVSCWKQ